MRVEIQQNLILRTKGDNQDQRWRLKPSIEYFIEQESSIGSNSKFHVSRKEKSKNVESLKQNKNNINCNIDSDSDSLDILKNQDDLRFKKMKLENNK
uniref:Uncharacterized protein n=1 Tax=Romanomermis culicivorax TaxID=13658 RepID=A0A915IMJ3_ROMCU